MRGMPYRDADDPQAEHAHARAFREGRHRTVAKSHADHEQADAVVRGVAEEIERIGLQRRRSSRQSGADLDCKHGGVDSEHDPQNPAVGCVVAQWVVVAMVAAAHTGRYRPSRPIFHLQGRDLSLMDRMRPGRADFNSRDGRRPHT